MKYKFAPLTAILFVLLFIAIVPSMAQTEPDLRQPLVGVTLLPNTDPSLADGALQIIDYDFFQWALFPANSRQAQANSVGFDLVLGQDVIDTSRNGNSAARVAASAEADFHLLQLIGPEKSDWRTELIATGLDVVQYIHPFTYVVYGTPAEVAAADSAEFVRWSSHLAAAYRQPPQTQQRQSADIVSHRVVIYRGADSSLIDSQLAKNGFDSADFAPLNATWAAVDLDLNQASAAALAQVPGIFTIQMNSAEDSLRSEMSSQFNVRSFGAIGNVTPGYRDWLSAVGVDGSGVIVANVDSGVLDTHPDLENRMLPCVGSTCGGTTSSGHGTHTAGIIAGDGSSGIMSNGFLRGLGVAPGAQLVEQRYSFRSGAADMLQLMQQSVANGAVISANSWGPAGTPRGYDNDTLQVDIGVRDSDIGTAGDQPLNYILSFMNGRGGTQSQGSPDEAKNVFTIGSTCFRANSTFGCSEYVDNRDISGNSAHGPALDGRTIPHMVAPGCSIDSTVLSNSYGFNCGTSMASPQVSGAAALFIEKYRNEFATDPSPALVKAVFTAVAESLAGNDDADNNALGQPFDSKQGWGLFNLGSVISPTHPVLYVDQTQLLVTSGDTYRMNIEPVVADAPVRIMLTWTDAPGHGMGGSTPAWNNNLDLMVNYGNDMYVGNQFDVNGWSTPSTDLDTINNTEGVFLESVGSGETFEIVVVGTNINSNGVPNNATPVDQDFALACYNCQTVNQTAVDLTLQKSASTPSPIGGVLASFIIGSIVTYTITRTVAVSDTYNMSTTLLDDKVSGLQVISDSIKVNGQSRPDVYNPITSQLVLTTSESISSTNTMVLSYQAKVTNAAVGQSSLVNVATTTVNVGGAVRNASADAEISLPQRYYFPIIGRK